MLKEFEIGPIRPPSEAASLLLRVTRNCPWNKCRFCDLYKGELFRVRSIEEIKADVDQVAAYQADIVKWMPDGALFDQNALHDKLQQFPPEIADRYFHVLHWMLNGGGQSIFLQDANTMALSFDKLAEILAYVREKLPRTQRVTSYGRVDSITRFSVGQLTALREAGLDRIHSGYESGSDQVLHLINKGYTKAEEIEAGQKVVASGIELSVYIMPGVGGKALSDDNAAETADVISKVNPDFVRVRTFVAKQGTGLMEDIQRGEIQECTDKEKVLELKKTIEGITGVTGYMHSDHLINLLEEVAGQLTTDKDTMLRVIQDFEDLPPREQREFQLARRMGLVRFLSQMRGLSPEQRSGVETYERRLQDEADFEAVLSKLLRRYI